MKEISQDLRFASGQLVNNWTGMPEENSTTNTEYVRRLRMRVSLRIIPRVLKTRSRSLSPGQPVYFRKGRTGSMQVDRFRRPHPFSRCTCDSSTRTRPVQSASLLSVFSTGRHRRPVSLTRTLRRGIFYESPSRTRK
jgi:hypothetical protein